jgi:hypothetical protein
MELGVPFSENEPIESSRAQTYRYQFRADRSDCRELPFLEYLRLSGKSPDEWAATVVSGVAKRPDREVETTRASEKTKCHCRQEVMLQLDGREGVE